MAKVTCECGKYFKDDSALCQHKRDSPKHQQKAEPSANAGSSNPIRPTPEGQGMQVPKELSTTGPVPYSSRYPPVQFVRAGQSSEAAATSKKKTKKKTGRGTGSSLPPIKFTEYGYAYTPDLGDEDWSVCDKDCGWCGHCADGLDI